MSQGSPNHPKPTPSTPSRPSSSDDPAGDAMKKPGGGEDEVAADDQGVEGKGEEETGEAGGEIEKSADDAGPPSTPNPHPANPYGAGQRGPGPGVGPGGSMYRPRPIKPRKVRGGVKLADPTAAFEQSWAAQRWIRLVEQTAPSALLPQGLDYANQGQTRTLSVEPGAARATVQGTIIAAYRTALSIPAFTHEQAELAVAAMVDQAVFAAKLLAGELPPSIEDVFGPLNLHLFPGAASIRPTCTCRDTKGAGNWCKHACCVAYLVADRLAADPFVSFTLRGLPKEELLERLRQRRAAAAGGEGGTLVYTPRVPGASEYTAPPLEESIESFWESGPDLAFLDCPIEPPEVSHPLLRRLGPSPFTSARFPLVGLLATCYEVISEGVIRSEAEGDEISTGEDDDDGVEGEAAGDAPEKANPEAKPEDDVQAESQSPPPSAPPIAPPNAPAAKPQAARAARARPRA